MKLEYVTESEARQFRYWTMMAASLNQLRFKTEGYTLSNAMMGLSSLRCFGAWVIAQRRELLDDIWAGGPFSRPIMDEANKVFGGDL